MESWSVKKEHSLYCFKYDTLLRDSNDIDRSIEYIIQGRFIT